jgi:hypothetical protein
MPVGIGIISVYGKDDTEYVNMFSRFLDYPTMIPMPKFLNKPTLRHRARILQRSLCPDFVTK